MIIETFDKNWLGNAMQKVRNQIIDFPCDEESIRQLNEVIVSICLELDCKSELLLRLASAYLTYILRLFPVSISMIKSYEDMLLEALNDRLLLTEWMLYEFLKLVFGFVYLRELKKYYFYEELDELINGNGTRYVRPLNIGDLIEIEKIINDRFHELMSVVKLKNKTESIFEPLPAIEWLELTEKILYEQPIEISSVMAQRIRYAFYNIDTSKAIKGIFPVSRYSANEAAEAIGISVDQLITDCFNEDFGAYIKEGKYKVHRFIHSPITCESVNYQSERLYIYSYKGLLRLKKVSELYPAATLEAIYKGAAIEIQPTREYLTVPVQGSLADYAKGEWVTIELRGNQRITVDDLVFIKIEIDRYIEKRKDRDELMEKKVPSSSVEILCSAVMPRSVELSEKTGRGQHNRRKREKILSISAAVIFQGKNVSSGKSIAKVVDATLTDAKLSFEKITRCINQWLQPLDHIETIIKDQEPTIEIVYGVIVAIAYSFRDQFLSKDFEKSVKLVSGKAYEIFARVGYMIELEVIKNFVANSANQIFQSESFSQ